MSTNFESIHDWFDRIALLNADAPAVSCNGESYTYRAVRERSDLIADCLLERELPAGSLVGLLCEQPFEFVCAVLGTLKAGLAFMPLDGHLPAARLRLLLSVAEPSLFLAERGLLAVVPAGEVICLNELPAVTRHRMRPAADPDGRCYIYFSSGSTGRPKAIAGRLKGIDHFIRWEAETLQVRAGMRMSQLLAPSFDGSLRELFLPLCTGGVMVAPGDRKLVQDASGLAKWLQAERVEIVHCVPSLLRSLCGVEEKFEELEWVVLAGEALQPGDVARWKERSAARLVNLYGTSETTMAKFCYMVADGDEHRRAIPIGKPIPGARAVVIDEKGKPCGTDMVGEIYIRTPYRSHGYYNDEEQTRAAFVPNPLTQNADDLVHRTGDLGRINSDGNFEYLGRRDQQVKVRGIRVELGEVEDALRALADVSDAVVIERTDASGNNYLCGYVACSNGEEVSATGARGELLLELPDYMVPSAIVVLAELPRTISGKVDKRALPAPGAVRGGLGEYIAARTPVEAALCEIWSEVLKVEKVGVRDNFFELGGHSLLATQVMSRIREARGVEMPLRMLFEGPTVEALAQKVEAAGEEQQSVPPIVRVSREAALPLSFAQQRLWFIDQLETNNPFYNIHTAVKLSGELNVPALEETLTEIVRRHESLRTVFAATDGQPVQVILPPGPFALVFKDFSALPVEEREAAARKHEREDAQQPFDLAVGPLLRASLLRLAREEHVVVLTMHHIISDGWSMGVLVDELATLYQTFSMGQPPALPEPAIQYADFAAWQRSWLQGEVLERQMSYWRRQLANTPALLELPADRPRPSLQSYRGAIRTFSLSADLSQSLREFSRREGVTDFMSLLAVFEVLLYRYTNQEELIVGTNIAGRTSVETEQLIGIFVNTLLIKAQLGDAQTFREFLRTVKEATLDAHANQDVPFERLVEELQPARDLSRHPLFQVMFVLQNEPQGSLEIPGLNFAPFGGDGTISAKFDLNMAMTDTSQGFIGTVEYSTDLFDDATIERMLGHFARLLEAVVQEPEQELGALPLLTAVERQALCWDDNATERDWPLDIPFHVQFEKQVAATPAAIAVRCEQAELSYRELAQAMDATAAKLCASGLQQGEVVALLADRGSEYVAALLGIMKAGGVYLPLDPQHPAVRQERLLQRAAVKLVLCAGEYEELLAGAENVRVLDYRVTAAAAWTTDEAWSNDEVWDASDLAYVIFTSGSTGEPKGAMIEQRGMLNHLHAKCEDLQLSASDVVAQNAPQGFDISIWQMLAPLLVGARVEVFSAAAARDPEALLRGVEARGVTVLETVPAMMRAMLEWSSGQAARPELRQLRYVISNAEALSVELAERWLTVYSGPELLNTWGATECSDDVTHERVVKGRWPGLAYVPLGQRLGNIRVYIVDGRGEPVPVGVVGELLIGGVSVGRGYLGDAERTRVSFINDYLRGDGARLYRTGDLGRWLSDGSLEFVGRVDEQVKVRGYRVEPGEVEAVLRGQAGVSEAVVVARATGAGEARLVGYVVCEAGRERSGAELRAALRGQLPEYLVPSAVVVLAELPLNANGKVDKRALPEPEYEADEESYEAPRTAVEEVLCGIWSEVLGVERIGVNDNFFELGGHSLLATQVMSRVRVALGVEVALRVLFEGPTVAALARAVEGELSSGAGESAPPLLPVSREGALPLSFAQQRLWFIDQLDPGSPLYNMSMAVRLSGELDVRALERTLSEVVRRHEVLRTSFPAVGGEPRQVIAPATEFVLPFTDLSELDEANREREAGRLAAAEARRGFDLAHGPLLRAELLKLAAQEHVVLLTMHHIVSDGWSMGVLLEEVAQLYASYKDEREVSGLHELAVQYADYAAWQRSWLAGEVLEAELSYWREQLADLPPRLELPADYARPQVQSFRGAELQFRLNADVVQQLRAVCREQQVTLFMALLGPFAALLSRYSGAERVVVGTPIAGRTRAETEPLIGFFVNTLALSLRVSGTQSWAELWRQVREVSLGAQAHQEVPFERLVSELQPERSLSQQPLVQVMFALQNATGGVAEGVELAGLQLSPFSWQEESAVGAQTAKFDLSLSLAEVGDEVVGSLTYATDLFAEETIGRLAQHYQRLVRAACAEPAQAVGRVRLLSEAEQEQLAARRQQRDYSRELSLVEQFAHEARRRPEAVALECDGAELSYGELLACVESLAARLQELGVGPGTVVGLLLGRSFEAVASVLAVWQTGAAYLPLEPSYPVERLRYMVQDAGVELLLVNSGVQAEWHEGEVLSLNDALTENRRPVAVAHEPQALAYLLYTSGTTGRPKAVAVEQRQLRNLLCASREEFGWRASDVMPVLSPLSFDISLFELLTPLLAGGRALLLQRTEVLESGALVRQLAAATVVHMVPSLLRQVAAELEAGGVQLGGVRRLLVGGELVPPELLRHAQRVFPRAAVTVLYGPTEATIVCTHKDYEAGAVRGGEWRALLGQSFTNVRLHIVNESGVEQPLGVAGEIAIGGAGVTRGYLGQAGLTASRYVPDSLSGAWGGRLYLTGDVGRWTGTGELEFLGRVDEQVKVRGFRVEPAEVAAVLEEQAQVRAAVVLARPELQGSGQRLVAYVVGSETLTTTVLREHLLARLPEYMVPAVFVMLDELPLNANGKLDKRALPDPDDSRLGTDEEYEAPRTLTEERLVTIWAEVLQVSRIGVNDSFFALGGHSLLATQVISRVNEAFGVVVPLRTLFEFPTIARLATTVEELTPANEVMHIEALPRGNSDLDQLLSELEELSEGEVMALLSE